MLCEGYAQVVGQLSMLKLGDAIYRTHGVRSFFDLLSEHR